MKKIVKTKRNGRVTYYVDMRDQGAGRKYFVSEQEARNYVENQGRQLEGVRVSDRQKKSEWTFEQLIDVYIEHLSQVGKNAHNKTRTMFDIKSAKIEGYRLDKMKVRDFVVGDIDSLVERIRPGRSKKTINEYMSHFKQLLEYGIRKGVISLNVFTQLPNGLVIEGNDNSVDHISEEPLSRDLIHTIADQLKGQMKVMYFFAAYSGLRSGELRALTWDDLDFHNGEINVNKAIKYDREYVFVNRKRYERGSYIVKKTKTVAGTRKVPMIDFIIKMMREYKLSHNAQSERVFESLTGGIISDSRFPAAIKAACDKANVGHIRWHDLRHYFASTLLKVYGNDWNRIKTYMGHSSIKTTIDVYGHWMENEQEKKDNRNLLNEKLGKIAER